MVAMLDQTVGRTASTADKGIDVVGGCGTTFHLPCVFLSSALSLLLFRFVSSLLTVSSALLSSVGVSVSFRVYTLFIDSCEPEVGRSRLRRITKSTPDALTGLKKETVHESIATATVIGERVRFGGEKVHDELNVSLMFLTSSLTLRRCFRCGVFSHFSSTEKVRRSSGSRVRECTGTPAHPS